MKTPWIFMIMLFGGTLLASDNPSISYINQYKYIAISEMDRTGIPASIKLAQGLLESGSGTSTLAVEANNHFGIKCGGAWSGETFHREYDDYNNEGQLIKSCFRKFDNPEQSYYAHSAFLTDQKRYQFLFTLPSGDYEGWAYGLKKAGYATDKAYPRKLINLIEKYELFQYDQAQGAPILADNTSPVEVEDTPSDTKSEDVVYEEPKVREYPTSSQRSKKTGGLKEDQVFHRVKKGETISEIAMIYDLDETKIRLRNRIPKDAEPLTGEKLYLKKKISLLNRPAFTRAPIEGTIAVDDEYIF